MLPWNHLLCFHISAISRKTTNSLHYKMVLRLCTKTTTHFDHHVLTLQTLQVPPHAWTMKTTTRSKSSINRTSPSSTKHHGQPCWPDPHINPSLQMWVHAGITPPLHQAPHAFLMRYPRMTPEMEQPSLPYSDPIKCGEYFSILEPEMDHFTTSLVWSAVS